MGRLRSSSILFRLLVAYLLPTLILLGAFGWLAYRQSRLSMEESLGRRLTGLAQAVSTQVSPAAVVFLVPGDDESRTARRMHKKLGQLRQRTRVERIVVLDPDLRFLADTRGSARIGDRYYHAEADRHELERVFAGGEASSVLFRGRDGRMYKKGYAPVLREGRVVAAVGVVGSAEFFEGLARLRTYIILSGAVVAVLVVLVTVLVARRLTRPLRTLASEASRIGTGDLAHPIRSRSKTEVGLLASTMNEMRKDLHTRDQQMQMMLSGIAHEVRNPLGGIELFAGLLREDLEDDPEKLENIQRIERELAYLKKVVEDFLDFARKRPPSICAVDLPSLAAETVELLRPEASDRGVELEAEPDHQLPRVRCDPEQLRRVLLNLTRNALQATPRGGEVRLVCAVRPGDDEQVTVEVRDNGSGIASENLEQIFTPFFTTREKGSGLGLALAKKIVDDNGGELSATSTPGEGSVFSVALPREPA